MTAIEYMIYGMIAIILLFVVMETDTPEKTKQEAEKQAKIKQCSDMGGIPILSDWDSRLANCIFKPTEKENERTKN